MRMTRRCEEGVDPRPVLTAFVGLRDVQSAKIRVRSWPHGERSGRHLLHVQAMAQGITLHIAALRRIVPELSRTGDHCASHGRWVVAAMHRIYKILATDFECTVERLKSLKYKI